MVIVQSVSICLKFTSLEVTSSIFQSPVDYGLSLGLCFWALAIFSQGCDFRHLFAQDVSLVCWASLAPAYLIAYWCCIAN